MIFCKSRLVGLVWPRSGILLAPNIFPEKKTDQ